MRLEDHLRAAIRRQGLAITTEKAYISWYKRFVRFNKMRHPRELGASEVEGFLNDLVLSRNVAISTQAQALNALVFLYRHVLEIELVGIAHKKSKKPKRLPTVLSREEIKTLLNMIPRGEPHLLCSLLYGCGLRVKEGLRLRLKDVDLENNLVWVREGKGASRVLKNSATCRFEGIVE